MGVEIAMSGPVFLEDFSDQERNEESSGELQNDETEDFGVQLPVPAEIVSIIFSHLDDKSLCQAELVCKGWFDLIADFRLWKELIRRKAHTYNIWQALAMRSNWLSRLEIISDDDGWFFRQLYQNIISDLKRVEVNWHRCEVKSSKIEHLTDDPSRKAIYCIQSDFDNIITGHRDQTIRIWCKRTRDKLHTITGHSGSVLCLQYNSRIIISGSSDSTVRVWDKTTREELFTANQHKDSVLSLKFDSSNILVTGSKDNTAIVWDIATSNGDIQLIPRFTLLGHIAPVNVVDYNEKYILTASGDRKVKVWSRENGSHVRELIGHTRGIASLQLRDGVAVTGSNDKSIRVWNIESGDCLCEYTGHSGLVRCLRYDGQQIVSGSYDGDVRLWTPGQPDSYIIGKCGDNSEDQVLDVEFNHFEILACTKGGKLYIWDFLEDSHDINYSVHCSEHS